MRPPLVCPRHGAPLAYDGDDREGSYTCPEGERFARFDGVDIFLPRSDRG